MNANSENRESELLARVNELQKKVYDLIVERDVDGDEIRALESALATEKARSRTLEDVLRRAAEDETGLMSRTICRAVLGGNPTWNPK